MYSTAPATPKAAATQERVSGETTEGAVQREAESGLRGLHLGRLRTLTTYAYAYEFLGLF